MTMLTGEETTWGGDDRNRMLAVALTLLEVETCNSCGTPAWVGHSTNNEIGFTVQSGTCFGCAEMQKADDADQRNKRKQAPGEFRYVVPHMVWPDMAIPSRSELYQEAEGK